MDRITDIDDGTVRRVDWESLIPATIFFRSFSASFKFSFVALGAFLIALLAECVGARDFLTELLTFSVADPAVVATFHDGRFEALISSRAVIPDCGAPVAAYFETTTSVVPFAAIATVGGALFLWLALAFSRATCVRLASSSRSSTFASLRFAFTRLLSALFLVATPCVLLFIGILILAVVERLGLFGEAFAPVVAFALLLGVVVVALVALAIPLGLSALATENCDGFDALARGVSYSSQRSLAWLFYLAIAFALAVLGACVFEVPVQVALSLYDGGAYPNPNSWTQLWRLALAAAPLSYFFFALVAHANAAYFMLRRSVDGIPYDECALDLENRAPRKLRAVLQDGKGAPTFDAELARAAQQKDADGEQS